MRRPQRNIEIFSMSVLDMFASALGAFIMCTVILFQYRDDVSKDLDAANDSLKQKTLALKQTQMDAQVIEEQIRRQEQAVRGVRESQANLNICKQGLNQCQVALAKNFIMVQIEWDKELNVDLYVTDPSGNVFFWRRTNRCNCDFPGNPTKARLSVDSRGACFLGKCGIEVWMDPEPKTGSYKIDYVVDRAPPEKVTVTGTVIDRLGKTELPPKSFDRGSRELRVRAAELELADNGNLEIR